MPTRDLIPVSEKLRDSVCHPVRWYSGWISARLALSPLDGR